MWVYRIPTAWCDADFRGLEMYGAAGTEFVFEGNMVRFGSFKTSPNRVPPHRRTNHIVRNLCALGISAGGRYSSVNVFPECLSQANRNRLSPPSDARNGNAPPP